MGSIRCVFFVKALGYDSPFKIDILFECCGTCGTISMEFCFCFTLWNKDQLWIVRVLWYFLGIYLTKQGNMIRYLTMYHGISVEKLWISPEKCLFGPLAHLVERFHGMEEVRSSILLRSTWYNERISKYEECDFSSRQTR